MKAIAHSFYLLLISIFPVLAQDKNLLGLDPNNFEELNSEVLVPGNSNPFLSGQPDGATTKSDFAPAQSPVFATEVRSGDTLSFAATGSVSFRGGAGPGTPDGASLVTSASALGIAGYGSPRIPLDALVGVFLNDGVPIDPAPDQLTYPAENFAFESLSPEQNQIFFIGDGLTGTGDGTRQLFVVPAGATRLFLGTSDGFGWFNNTGEFSVSICRLASQVEGPKLEATNVFFDQENYEIDFGETLVGMLKIDPIPVGGLYSQGTIITVRNEAGSFAGVVTPTPSPVLNQNGIIDEPQLFDNSETGISGLKGSALFTTSLPTLNIAEFAGFSIAGLAPDSYVLELQFLNQLGPTEDIFVTGCCLSLDDFITFSSAQLEVIGNLLPEITVTGPITLQRQTGLLEQRLTLTNNTGRTLNGFRLFLTDLPDDVVAFNAQGEVNGIPYIDIFADILPGESIEILLEFFRPSRVIDFEPTFTLGTAGQAPQATDGSGAQALNLRVVNRNASGLLLEFDSLLGTSYLIEYSEDMVTWQLALPAVEGNGQRRQWLDQGPPQTSSFPDSTRFYRITPIQPNN